MQFHVPLGGEISGILSLQLLLSLNITIHKSVAERQHFIVLTCAIKVRHIDFMVGTGVKSTGIVLRFEVL